MTTQTIPTGFWKGAGIPKGKRVNTFAECGCCGAFHRTDFHGDCREDSERHWDLPDDAEVIYLEDDDDDDDGLEMHDDSCGECGHPYKRGDETHYPECSRIRTCVLTGATNEDPDDCTTHDHEDLTSS